MDLEPWIGQIGLGAAAVILFLSVGRSYINYIGRQLEEARQAHQRELDRLTMLWESRLQDSIRRGDAWETAAHRYEQASRESAEQARRGTAAAETAVALLRAIRDEQQGHR